MGSLRDAGIIKEAGVGSDVYSLMKEEEMNTPLLDGIVKSSAFIPWDKLGKPGVLPIAGSLLGAGSGALLNPDNRLKGATIGAGSGALLGLLGNRALGHTLRGNYLMQDAKENAARIKAFLKEQYV